jgi:hypothetical protein
VQQFQENSSEKKRNRKAYRKEFSPINEESQLLPFLRKPQPQGKQVAGEKDLVERSELSLGVSIFN